MRPVVWWVCLVMAPAILAGIELFHPAHFTASPGMYQFLSHAEYHHPEFSVPAYFGPDWWFTLHMIQTPLVGLVAVGLWLTLARIDDRVVAAQGFAWLARAAIFVFLIYYTVLDSIGGIGLGRTILAVQSMAAAGKLSPQQTEGITLLLNAIWVDPWIGGVGSWVSETGSWAILAASVFMAAALWLADTHGRFAVLPLLGFGWELQVSHASPHGPIAFVLLIVASCWLAWSKPRNGSEDSGVAAKASYS